MDFAKIKQAAEQYDADMTKFLRDLVRIPGESCQEKGHIERIKEEMEKVGFDRVEVDPMGNILGYMGSGEKLIAFDAHIDNVGIGNIDNWEFDPYEGYENETNRDWCDNIALYITEWDRYIPPVDANPYLPVTNTGHEAYVNDCKKAVQDMVQVYFDLTTDQANDMWQMEKGQVCDMLYSKCMDLYPEE